MVDLASVNYLPEVDEYPAAIPQLEDGWWPTGGAVDPAADNGLMNWQAQLLARRTHWLRARQLEQSADPAMQLTVGATGDFKTLNAAVERLSQMRPRYLNASATATIRILAGFTMAEQVFVRGFNLGWVQIVSDDPFVPVSRAALTQKFGATYPVFGAHINAELPQIKTKFSADGSGVGTDRCGVELMNAGAFITEGNGFVGSFGFGAYTLNGRLSCVRATFDGATQAGIVAVRGSLIGCQEATARGCPIGLMAVQGSFIDAKGANFSSCTNNGVNLQNMARADLTNANVRKGATDTALDLVLSGGAAALASGMTGGSNIARNTLTANGIIYG